MGVRRIMSAQDGTAPPVLFVVGTAGAGKSSLVTAFQRWARFLEVDVLTINLDPGAERVHYDPEFDVRDLVSLSDVMDEYDLGPNGAQILAADLVASQAEDVFEEIDGISGDIMIVDTPGQVELFAFREASSHLVEVIGQGRACLVFLFDPMLSQTPSGFVSQMLLSSIVHFRLGLPTANFLSKSDLLDPETLEKILEWGDNLDVLESALYEESAQQSLNAAQGGQRAEFAIGQLRMMKHASIQPGLIPLSSEMEEGLADILTFAQSIFGGMADTRDGFQGDIEHEL
ncbi:MAG: GTPase [Methanobacteriota archaeon]|nr:MAG: GTPase [Euryarchaeota archaeon]HIE63858.1 GTPase [Candidatus Poseidoniales archaeon]HIK99809.1 GTPase [Candidatus Poseidoniales archaeon]